MIGGGTFGWAPGEWTDDTVDGDRRSPRSPPTGADLRRRRRAGPIAAGWADWAPTARTSGSRPARCSPPPAAAPTGERGAARPRRGDRTAPSGPAGRGGNGSLMRTAPVALAYLDDPDALVEAAHRDQRADPLRPRGRRGVRAVVPGDPARGPARRPSTGCAVALDYLPTDRAASGPRGSTRPRPARPPTSTTTAGSSQALQGAWSAITRTAGARSRILPRRVRRRAPAARARGGRPRRPRHRHRRRDRRRPARRRLGRLRRPGRLAAHPARLARPARPRPGPPRRADRPRRPTRTGRAGPLAGSTTPAAATAAAGPPPPRRRVWLAGVDCADSLPDGVDAVVSLCRLGADAGPRRSVRPPTTSRSGWSTTTDPAKNPNLDFVLDRRRRGRREHCAPRAGRCCCTASRPRAGPPRSPRSTVPGAPAEPPSTPWPTSWTHYPTPTQTVPCGSRWNGSAKPYHHPHRWCIDAKGSMRAFAATVCGRRSRASTRMLTGGGRGDDPDVRRRRHFAWRSTRPGS